MQSKKKYCWYVRYAGGDKVLQLGSCMVSPMGVSSEQLRNQLGKEMGYRGWNHVAMGAIKFYSDEGFGIGVDDLIDVEVDDLAMEIRCVISSVVEVGVSDGSIELPSKRGYQTVWKVAEGEEGGVDEIEGLVREVLTKEALGKYTKGELVSMADSWGIDGVSMSMKKAEMIDYIIKNG